MGFDKVFVKAPWVMTESEMKVLVSNRDLVVAGHDPWDIDFKCLEMTEDARSIVTNLDADWLFKAL